MDAKNTHGAATATTQEQQVTGVLGTDLFAKGAIDLDGTATVNQDAKASTHGGGNATANVFSGPNFNASGGLAMEQRPLDGVTGIAYTGNIDGQSTVDLDGIASYTGSADADNTTGNANARVGNNSQPLQATVGALLVTPNDVNSNGDMTINGQATAMTTSSATTTTGSANASLFSNAVKGIKTIPGVELQSDGGLIIDGLAQIGTNTTATAIGGTGKNSIAESNVTNVVGVDMSELDSVTAPNGQIKADAKGDIDFKGVASTNLNSNSLITKGSALAKSISSFVSGINIRAIVGGADATILGDASNTSNASATSTGDHGASNTATALITNSDSTIGTNGFQEGSTIAPTITIGGNSSITGNAANTQTANSDITTGNATSNINATDTIGINNIEFTLKGNNSIIQGSAIQQDRSTAKAVTGNAVAKNNQVVTGVRTQTEVLGMKDVSLAINGNSEGITSSAYNQTISTATTTTGDAQADSGVVRIVGAESVDLDIKGSITGDGFAASATGYFDSYAESTNGSNTIASIDARSVGGNTKGTNDSYKIGGNGDIDLDAQLWGYGESKTTGNSSSDMSQSSVKLDATGAFLRKNPDAIVISGNGDVDGNGVVSGYSKAYGVTSAAKADADIVAKGLNLQATDSKDSGIKIKGEGDITASGYIGTLEYNELGGLTLSPFNVEAITTTGNSETFTSLQARGITGTADTGNKSITTNGGDITGTGAVVLTNTSKTTYGLAKANSMTNIVGIQEIDMTSGGSDNLIKGEGIGWINVNSINTNGDANATSTVNGIGIDGGTNGITANVIGEVKGVAQISQTVMAKTVNGSATAEAISGSIIGIKNTSIHSAGDLVITANASLNSTAYSETIGGM